MNYFSLNFLLVFWQEDPDSAWGRGQKRWEREMGVFINECILFLYREVSILTMLMNLHMGEWSYGVITLGSWCNWQKQQQREHEEDMRARLKHSESIEKAAVSFPPYFLNPKAFRPCIDSKATDTFKPQRSSKDIVKIVHVTSVIQLYFSYFLCAKKTKRMTLFNNFFFSVLVFDACS